jgi:hypothetical protein
VFCGNGSHGNPEREVLEMFFNSRLGHAGQLALAPRARGRDFTFWFSTSSAQLSAHSRARKNFEDRERLVADLVSRSGGRMHAEFNDGDAITLAL